VISSVNPLAPGAAATFAMNGEVAVDGTAVGNPPVAAFTLTTSVASCSAPAILSADSVKTHDTAGDFGIPLGISPAVGGVECRQGGTTRIDVIFDAEIVAADGMLNPGAEVAVSSGTISNLSIIGGDLLRIELSGVPARSCLEVTISGLACDAGGGSPGAVMIPATLKQRNVLGDTTGNARVTTADINLAKSGLGPAIGANFRSDLDLGGSVGASDENRIKAETNYVPAVCSE
jgi:hypothetical protein